jgi:hypothetical protein
MMSSSTRAKTRSPLAKPRHPGANGFDRVDAVGVDAGEEFTSPGRRLRHVGQRRVLRSAVA